jgi:hypothetical protein
MQNKIARPPRYDEQKEETFAITSKLDRIRYPNVVATYPPAGEAEYPAKNMISGLEMWWSAN